MILSLCRNRTICSFKWITKFSKFLLFTAHPIRFTIFISAGEWGSGRICFWFTHGRLKTAADAESLGVGWFLFVRRFLMGVLELAGSHIGLLLRYFARLIFTCGGTVIAALTWHSRIPSCECELFSAGARACQGGSMNWSFERQMNVLGSLMMYLGTLRKRLRSPTITRVCLSSGFENRSETSRFDSVLVALLRDVPVNLCLILVCTTLTTL